MKFHLKKGVILVLILIVLAAALYFTFRPVDCVSLECFQDRMAKCSKARYVNEDPKATWGYDIKGSETGGCLIEITLLTAKEGELGIDAFEGNKMSCIYPRGVSAFPEKDLDRCSGVLKENFQEVMIDRLHTYILDNLGEIKDELRGI